MLVGGYWSQRKESREDSARRILGFLGAIYKYNDEVSKWYKKGSRRSISKRSPIDIDPSSISSNLKSNHTDIGRQLIPELGFQFSAWNGTNISFSVEIGSWSQYVRNSAVMKFEEDFNLVDSVSLYKNILSDMILFFDPDDAVVTSYEYMQRANAEMPWEAGIFTYSKGEAIQHHG